MNPETVTLIERPYQEIVDDILTAIVGGVVNEPNLFDVKTDLYPLAEPALDVRGITGDTEDGDHRQFTKEVDYIFDVDKNAVIWQKGGTWPDDGSTFLVDYFRQNSRSPLSDINVGSVTRTMGEAIGREIATVYQQINEAYLSGFVDTATGKSLDLVVAILGITRKTKDFAVGLVTFFRDTAVEGNITIPQGTLLATTKGEVTFETTEPRTLQRGQTRIDVPVRAGAAFKGDKGKVAAGDITKIAQAIAGIGQVKNFEPTFLGAEDESDEDLRLRAKAALRALGKGTLAAILRVIFEGRATPIEIWDPNGPLAKRSDPGNVLILVESEPERFASLRGAVEETRAAGVVTTLAARYVFFKPRIAAHITAGLTPAGKLKVQDEIIAALQDYVDGLGSGDAADGSEMLKAIRKVADVKPDTLMVDVMAWQSDVGHLGSDTLVDAVMAAVESAPPGDPAALRALIDSTVNELPPLLPSNRRIPNRGLVQGKDSSARATDTQLEKGEFKVIATINGELWWVALDMERADIALRE